QNVNEKHGNTCSKLNEIQKPLRLTAFAQDHSTRAHFAHGRVHLFRMAARSVVMSKAFGREVQKPLDSLCPSTHCVRSGPFDSCSFAARFGLICIAARSV